MRYDFSRFAPTSFQTFVQALALHVFGSGLQVYGAGPDGARDATFEGRANYPSTEQCWDGYTVIQVKYKDKLTHDSKDADWLVAQIKREQTKWEQSKTFRRPDYYLLVTNVDLSPMPVTLTRRGKLRKGGMEKVSEALDTFRRLMKFKATDVWAAEKLSRLVDTAPAELRQNYAFWITPNEILWKTLQDGGEPNFAKLIARAAAQDMRENKYTRLQEAGHSSEENTLLSQVFIDLPVRVERGHSLPIAGQQSPAFAAAADEPGGETDKRQLGVTGLLSELSTHTFGHKYNSDSPAGHETPDAGRVVLLGGPGQGKSTITQYLVQVFEARLITAPKAPGVAKETLAYAKEVLESAKVATVPLSGSYRIPIRIVLPGFADQISQARKANSTARVSLLEYAAQRLSRQADMPLSTSQVRTSLGRYPWFIALDGLDEVPPSGERPAILNEIEALFDEIADCKADVLVVVTTRSQGYNKDLDPQLWLHWELTPLEREDALRYANRLSEVRLAEPSRRNRVMTRLTEAATSPATSQLMISPLQVAILFTLVDLKGDIPTDRWSLFNRYFAVLRDREEAKGGPSGELLRRHRTAVESIHHRAAFLLHVEAERSGGAQSYLTTQQFETLVNGFLSETGHDGLSLNSLTAELSKLATDRLVLLASKVEGRIAFDVRSLQEYMAAAMVTSGKDTFVERRMRAIAGKAHWRHVFEIAASRCFAETDKEHLTDVIIHLCAELDAGSDDDADRLSKSGARLAIDLLADGIGAELPKQKRLLFDRALGILDLGPDLLDHRLALIVDSALVAHCADHLRSRVSAEGSSRSTLAAWALLRELLSTSHASWATDLAKNSWPTTSRNSVDVLRVITHGPSLGSRYRFPPLISDAFVSLGFEQVSALPTFSKLMSAIFDQDMSPFSDRADTVTRVPLFRERTSLRCIGRLKQEKALLGFCTRKSIHRNGAPLLRPRDLSVSHPRALSMTRST
jgi:hypothetical protein